MKDVIGQQAAKQKLIELITHNRLSHGLLFLSKEGSGALPLALSLASFLACESVERSLSGKDDGGLFGRTAPEVFTDSCGKCAACNKTRQFIHPDIHFSYPVITKKAGEKPKSTDFIKEWREFLTHYPYGNVFDWLQFINAENKQGNITAEECSDIIRKLNLKSFESPYKILIMWMPEFLGKEGNKLLKLIEEPPANTLFIFVAENDEQILPTILSRLQLIKIPALNDDDIAERLMAKSGTDAGLAAQLASLADGNYREALQLLQHAEADWQELTEALFTNTYRKKPNDEQIKWIEELSGLGREKQKQFFIFFTHLLGRCLREQLTGSGLFAGEKMKQLATRINRVAGVGEKEAMIEEAEKAIYYIERNANARMLFHAFLIKVSHIINYKTLILT